MFSYAKKLFQRLSIRRKMVFLFLPIPILTILIVGLFWYWNALDAIRNMMEHQTTILAKNISLRIEDYLGERELEIHSVTQLAWVENFFRQDARASDFEDRFKKLLLNLNGEYFQITCFDSRNQPIAKVQLSAFLPKYSPAYFETRHFDDIDRLGVELLNEQSDDPLYVSDVVSFRGVESIVFGAPIFDLRSPDGKPGASKNRIGALTFIFPVSRITERLLQRYDFGFEYKTWLMDKRGVLLYHWDKNKISQNSKSALPFLLPHLKAIWQNRKTSVQYTDEVGEDWILSASPVENPSWLVGVSGRLQPFRQSTERAGIQGLVITLGVSILLLFLIFMVSKGFVNNISEVTEGANAIAAGDLDRQLPVRSGDEVGKLATTFNTMTANLKRLIQERRANESLIAIGRFSAALAHDLRNPIEGLKLLSGQLHKRMRPEQAEYEFTDAIQISVNRLATLVQDSLDFARLEAPEFQRLNLQELIDEVLTDFNLDSVVLRKNFPQQPTAIEADRPQLKRVISNIVKNALEACRKNSSARKPQIEIDLLHLDGTVKIMVCDSGAGIAPEVHERIFEPFFSTKVGGHGLGLALVQQILSNHGGKIAFKNEIDGGVRFIIELPMQQT